MRAAVHLVAAVAFVGAAGCGRYGFDGDDGAADDTSAPPRLRITVTDDGGRGTVVGPDGLMCTDACEVELVPGETITLRGIAATDAWLAGWDSAVCGGNFDCTFEIPETIDDDIAIDAVFRAMPNRAFITSTAFDGALGGTAAADTECLTRATAAGLDGIWIAYLSSSTSRAYDRLADSRGWIRMDGAPIADFPAQLSQGPLQFAPYFDEVGAAHPHESVHLGTYGVELGTTCDDWQTNAADVTGTGTTTDFGTNTLFGWGAGCDVLGHLLCVETGRYVEVRAFPDTGKLAFVSSAPWQPGVGTRDSADALCQSDANADGRTGTFLAALSTTTESIASRFEPGAIWTRVDGIRLMRDGSFMTTDTLDVAPELTLLGEVDMLDYWTGTLAFDQPSQLSENCADWTIGTEDAAGTMHWTSKVDVSQPQKFDACTEAVPVLCLEH